MSLWTPGGEHTPEPEQGPTATDATYDMPSMDDLSPEERARLEQMQSEMAAVHEQLLGAPAAVVIANHAMGIYELAAIHLTADQPKLGEAVLAIDALSALVENLGDRLGEPAQTLREALAQLKAAYLEVRARSAAEGA